MEITFAENEDGKSAVASLGDVIAVRLAENPTTGYQWAVVDVDRAVLEPQDASFLPNSAAIGGGGAKTVRFLAVGKGVARVELALRRTWEESASAIQRFGFMVEVRD